MEQLQVEFLKLRLPKDEPAIEELVNTKNAQI